MLINSFLFTVTLDDIICYFIYLKGPLNYRTDMFSHCNGRICQSFIPFKMCSLLLCRTCPFAGAKSSHTNITYLHILLQNI